MERPILRSELRSASSTPPPPSDDEGIQRLRNLSNLQYAIQDTTIPDAPGPAAEDDDEELAFNLFAPTASTANAEPSTGDPTSTAQKIRLRSPSLNIADAGFAQPARNRSYYFAFPADGQKKFNFEASALSTSQIFSLSHHPWPGSVYPWKVLHISVSDLSRIQRLQLSQHAPPSGSSMLGKLDSPPKRRRLGKKARIAVRQKHRAEVAKQEQASKSKEVKETEEKEKRVRRNREKKLKRRAKEKAKKAAGGLADAGEESSTDGD